MDTASGIIWIFGTVILFFLILIFIKPFKPKTKEERVIFPFQQKFEAHTILSFFTLCLLLYRYRASDALVVTICVLILIATTFLFSPANRDYLILETERFKFYGRWVQWKSVHTIQLYEDKIFIRYKNSTSRLILNKKRFKGDDWNNLISNLIQTTILYKNIKVEDFETVLRRSD